MNRLSASMFFAALLVISLIMVGMVRLGGAQTSGTGVSGIIVTDTTWSQSGSPYSLIGNLLVNNGAILTIQPGTTVNIASYYLMVNGTLQAIGTSANPVTFNSNTNYYGGSSNTGIILTQFSKGWNSITSTGCIIQYSIVNSQLTVSNSAELDQNEINYGVNVQSNVNGLQNGTAVISGNTITGSITVGNALGSAIIINNTISGGGISFGSMNAPSVQVIGNSISGCGTGINVGCWGGFNSSSQIIMNNMIFNNTIGVNLADWEGGGPSVENNTITNNTVGICVSYPWGNNKPVLNAPIMGNNLGGNSRYDFQNQQPTTVNAAYNWWGTTDTQAISQLIYDYYDDFNIGVVNYAPFLNASNPQASIELGPSPTPVIPNPTPTPQPPILTQTNLDVAPNPVGVGQTVTINFWLNQLPPLGNGTNSNRWTNITVGITQPDGTHITLGPFMTNATGRATTVFTPTQVGYLTFQAFFSGETISNIYYEPSSSNIIPLSVQQQPVQSPSPVPTPPSPLPTPTATPVGNNGQSSSLLVTTDKGAIVDIGIAGNITTYQISNAIISTNQSATTTIVEFTVTGQSGTVGFSNMTIPKNEVPFGKMPIIYIDTQLAPNQGNTQDEANYYVWYTTHFSTHQVSIEFTEVNTGPEQTQTQPILFELIFGVGVGLAIAALILVVLNLIIRTESKNRVREPLSHKFAG